MDNALEHAKEKAKVMLQRARSTSKVSTPEKNPEMLDRFQNLPSELAELRDHKHSLQVQADMCEGIDPAVSGLCVLS